MPRGCLSILKLSLGPVINSDLTGCINECVTPLWLTRRKSRAILLFVTTLVQWVVRPEWFPWLKWCHYSLQRKSGTHFTPPFYSFEKKYITTEPAKMLSLLCLWEISTVIQDYMMYCCCFLKPLKVSYDHPYSESYCVLARKCLTST